MSSSVEHKEENGTKKQKTDSVNEQKQDIIIADNFIGGKFVQPCKGNYIDVVSPADGSVIGKVAVSTKEDVEQAVKLAEEAFKTWSAETVKNRAQIMFRFHALLGESQHENELADLIVKEHGKNKAEALAEVAKGRETVEYATSMPQLIGGRILEVSRGVTCREVRKPQGVVASIVPFNFPCMVPLWTLPIAIATGNCFILKPSEKVPLTTTKICDLLTKAGLPKGVFTVVNGMREAVEAIIDSEKVKAVTFVGSTKVAEIVAKRCRNLNKRVLALGGAKNHLVTMPDCNVEMAAQDIVNSFTGCTGQRCMAASVLLTIGDQKELVKQIVDRASVLVPGSKNREIGPVIDKIALDRIHKYIDEAEQGGAKILLDGRGWTKTHEKGFWIGPTVIHHTNRADPAMKDEIFGPVLSIYNVKTKEEAVEIQNGNEYGNAAAVYTSSGETAEWFADKFSSGMLGINIGVPVPREPFSFGGTNASKFGDMDITGDGGIEFFTKRIKITTKWNPPPQRSWMD